MEIVHLQISSCHRMPGDRQAALEAAIEAVADGVGV